MKWEWTKESEIEGLEGHITTLFEEMRKLDMELTRAKDFIGLVASIDYPCKHRKGTFNRICEHPEMPVRVDDQGTLLPLLYNCLICKVREEE